MAKAENPDAYIAAAPEFARPLLTHFRALVHRACADVNESIKWSHVFFESRGMLCAMAAFKEHCSFGFWHKGMRSVLDEEGLPYKDGSGDFGPVRSRADLPSDAVLMRLIRAAVALNAAGIPSRATRPPRKPLAVPTDLAEAFKTHPAAARTFEKFTPSQRREYVDWITEAKRKETRAQRLVTTLQWLAEGKKRNWKYAGY
jgi:uncharacterized protein YdeI (YjbR/CyaY-like superfamily)